MYGIRKNWKITYPSKPKYDQNCVCCLFLLAQKAKPMPS